MKTTTARPRTSSKTGNAAPAVARLAPAIDKCPACGSGDIEDNGCKPSSHEYTLRCCACNEQWMPNDG